MEKMSNIEFANKKLNQMETLGKRVAEKTSNLIQSRQQQDFDSWYSRVLRLSRKMRENAVIFEQELLRGVEHYKVNLSDCYKDNEGGDMATVLLRIGKSVDIHEVPISKYGDSDKFREDFRNYIENISPPQQNEENSFLTQQLLEMFASDDETSIVEPGPSVSNEKSPVLDPKEQSTDQNCDTSKEKLPSSTDENSGISIENDHSAGEGAQSTDQNCDTSKEKLPISTKSINGNCGISTENVCSAGEKAQSSNENQEISRKKSPIKDQIAELTGRNCEISKELSEISNEKSPMQGEELLTDQNCEISNGRSPIQDRIETDENCDNPDESYITESMEEDIALMINEEFTIPVKSRHYKKEQFSFDENSPNQSEAAEIKKPTVNQDSADKIPESDCSSDSNATIIYGNQPQNSPEWYEKEKIAEILKWADEEDSLSWILDSSSSDEEESEKQKEMKGIKDCYVKLVRENLEKLKQTASKRKIDDDEYIDRLCDLSMLENRKKRPRPSNIRSLKLKRRRKLTPLSGSDTPDLSDAYSISDNEIANYQGNDEQIEHFETLIDPNKLLSQIVADIARSSSENEESDEEHMEKVRKLREKTDEVRKLSEKTEKKSGTEGSDSEDGDSKKNSWRNDPLLQRRFSVGETSRETKINSNDSDNDSDTVRKSLRKQRNSYNNNSNTSSSDSEDDLVVIDRETTSSDETDCEIVDCSGALPFDIKEEPEHERQRKGRKNILSVLSNDSLQEATQKAARDEEMRVLRLEKRLQSKMSQSQESTTACLVLDTTKDGYEISVDEKLTKRMYPHQIEGVKFMWNACYENVDNLNKINGIGCILAHNMGLGKSFQVFTLVHTLFRHSITNTNHVLIVCPLSTTSQWNKEFVNGFEMAKSCEVFPVFKLESCDSADIKAGYVRKWREKQGVLIVGYEAFQKLQKRPELKEALVNPGPDLVVCDEGHLLKNGKTLRAKALMQIRTKRRIALTGTPLQNNLSEYYHMVQFVKPNLLGTKQEFNRQFANPIKNGQYENSGEYDIKLMKQRSHVLHRILKNTVQRYEGNVLKGYLQEMLDYALFIQLHPEQEKLYRMYIDMLNSRTSNRKKTFFNDSSILKFISSHPQLLNCMEAQNAVHRGKKKIVETDTVYSDSEAKEIDPPGWWKDKVPDDLQTNIAYGTKLLIMLSIVEEAEKLGEKVLIFTSSLVELNTVEYFLKLQGTANCRKWNSKIDYFRMDGTVPPHKRNEMCEYFNDKKNTKMRLFLMSHKVGGLGLNLVAANRVILLGANFNPSYDSQSIHRVYRFGQEKPVFVYRLIAMGTMEEKLYNRCITKLAIASRVIDKHQIKRHYKDCHLDDLYKIDIDLTLKRTTLNKPKDDLLSNILLKFDCIFKYHQHQKLLENRPDEDLNKEDKIKAWEEFKSLTANKTIAPQMLPQQNQMPPLNPSTIQNIMRARIGQLYPIGQPNNGSSLSDRSNLRRINATSIEQKISLLLQETYNRKIQENIQHEQGSNQPSTSAQVQPLRPSIPNITTTSNNTINRNGNFLKKTSSDDFQKLTNKNLTNTPRNSTSNEETIVIDEDDLIVMTDDQSKNGNMKKTKEYPKNPTPIVEEDLIVIT